MTDNLRKDLELVEVAYDNNGKKAILRFLDIENAELLEVNFNKQTYENGEFIDDKKKEEQVEEWCKEYFDSSFDELETKVGVKKDVYKYGQFNSLWEVNIINKFDKKDKGKIFQSEIKEVVDTGQRISVKFEYEGKTYEKKFQYSDYVESLEKWFVNPQKKDKQYERFEELFGVSVEEADRILGKPIMVEVKIAYGKYPYADIKKPEWA